MAFGVKESPAFSSVTSTDGRQGQAHRRLRLFRSFAKARVMSPEERARTPNGRLMLPRLTPK